MNEEYFRHRSGVADLTRRMVEFTNPDIHEGEVLKWFLAGLLHDVGKEVLSKKHPGLFEKQEPLTEKEWSNIRMHTTIGFERLSQSCIKDISSAALAALEHHERWNGSGYLGKRAKDICLQGRVVAVADVYDALCHDRPYRKVWSREDALDYMQENSGILFDPEWVDVLIAIEENGGKF